MSRINLLPDQFIESQHRRRKAWQWGAAAFLLAAICLMWAALAYRHIGAMSLEVVSARAKLDQELRQLDELTVANSEHRQLHTLLAIPAGVELPVPTSGLLSVFGQLLPESVALTRLMIEMPPVVTVSPPREGPGGRRASTTGGRTTNGRDANSAAAAARPIRIEMEGIALSSSDIARLVTRLAGHRLFSDVTLTRSRNVTLAEGAPSSRPGGASGQQARVSFLITMNVAVRAAGPDEIAGTDVQTTEEYSHVH